MQPETTSKTSVTPTNDQAPRSPAPQTTASSERAGGATDGPATTRKGRAPKAKPASTKKSAKKAPSRPSPTSPGMPSAGNGPAEHPLTLEQLAKLYVKHLEKAGKSPTTQISYAQDLLLAIEHFGAQEPVEHLTGARIQVFSQSDPVVKTKTGRAKAKPTILKTRRVLRQALTWAAEQGLIAKAPEIDRDAEKVI